MSNMPFPTSPSPHLPHSRSGLRPDLRIVTAKNIRTATPAYTMGFTRRELRRLVAEMID